MARHQLLNNVEHKDLRISNAHSAELGDDLMFTPAFPAEFRSIQAHYPIVFRQFSNDAPFQPLALFGFRDGQNLFLKDGHWDASYLPMAIERQPFLIGKNGDELVIHVDMDSPRICASGEQGIPVFLPHGGSSDYLERINSLLLAIHQGIEGTPAFVEELQRLSLLESFVLDVDLPDGSQNRLAGFHTINEERLQSLPGDDLERLARNGHLQAIYMAIASLSSFPQLIERHRLSHVEPS